jgi:hypothetical protein
MPGIAFSAKTTFLRDLNVFEVSSGNLPKVQSLHKQSYYVDNIEEYHEGYDIEHFLVPKVRE